MENWTVSLWPISGHWLARGNKLNFNVKRAVVLGVIVSLSLTLDMVPAQAQGELRVIHSSAQALFPMAISFNLNVESDVDITDIRLHYKVLRHSYADVTGESYLQFESSTMVEVTWNWDMRRSGGLPPGTSVQYWWTVKDASDKRTETSPVVLEFDDERFSWQSLTQDMVTLYWYEGEQSFADEVMLTIEGALDWLETDTGASLLEPIRIYLYADSQDLQGSMIFPQEWTGGVTFKRFRCIAIGFGPENLEWGKRALIHELTHMVVYQMTINPYSHTPTWLDEGLAMRSEGPLEPFFLTLFNQAVITGSLISVQSLSSPFSAISDLSYLSYAESYHLVDYLITTFGKSKMLKLLETFREGASYDGALMAVYGFDTSGFDQRWREYLSEPIGTITVGAVSGN